MGRPRLLGGTVPLSFHLYLTPTEWNILVSGARSAGVSKSEFVRRMLRTLQGRQQELD
jgi:hypothetical protein